MNNNKYLYKINVRRALLVAGAALPALAWARMACAQSKDVAQKPVRIGILTEGASASYQARKPFFDRMQELGWVEGRNVTYDKVHADGDLARLPELATALVARRPDVIYVGNMKTAKALGITIPQSFLIQATQVIE